MSSDPVQNAAQAGVAAWQRGDAAAARRAFESGVAAGRATPQLWLLLAQACEALSDMAATHIALDQVLAADGRNLFALTMKGDLLIAAGDDRAAVAFYQLALTNTPPPAEQSADLRAQLARAAAAAKAVGARFEAHLNTQLDAAGVTRRAAGARFAEALGILNGTQAAYPQQPTSFYYPRLPLVEFFDPAAFEWVGRLEAAVPAMRAELNAVLADGGSLQPYVAASPNRPNRGHALLNDPKWSAFYLWQDGAPTVAARRHCPATLAALEAAPLPRNAGRSPMALFSVLRPDTHIPPHNGMHNTRLICHIPLVVPNNCRLRVGNETRTVEPGRAMIFDDSIEHEAWNDSAETRVVLMFEVWRPELYASERSALTLLFEAIGEYPGA